MKKITILKILYIIINNFVIKIYTSLIQIKIIEFFILNII